MARSLARVAPSDRTTSSLAVFTIGTRQVSKGSYINGILTWRDIQNGLANSSAEPSEIKQIHEEEVAFVTQWLSEWKGPGKH
jgi:hypothetical protein